MKKILQLSTFGLKNIETPIVLDFSNQTIVNGASKVNNIKGIYGYNGAGKTAFITSMFYYKNIVSNIEFLMQNEIKSQLKDLINKKLNVFSYSTVFDLGKNKIVKHSIELTKNENNGSICISKESVGLITGRTLNEKYLPLIERFGTKITILSGEKEHISKYLNENEELNASFIALYINRLLSNLGNGKNQAIELSSVDSIFLHLYVIISSIEVCTLKSDEYSNRSITKEQILELLSKTEKTKEKLSDDVFYDIDDIVISKDELASFRKNNKKLVKFIQVFKPELKDIKLKEDLNNDKVHISRILEYENYDVYYKYESSGIKQLVTLFSYLNKCANGEIVFIDEMDVNINAVYFKKLVSYFVNFGKGQLIFTTHNIESMDAIKNQRRAINVIGNDGTLDTWVSIGNRSPIKDYMGGYFVHSPMNIEDFDFITIFEGK